MATHSSVLAWRIPGTGEAWWAALYGVTQSWTRLKQLSSSSSIRKNQILPFVIIWMDLEGIMLNDLNQTKTNTI